MTKFDELRSSYKTTREKGIQYWRQAESFARHFAKAFADYLGAPKSFEDLERRSSRPYVEAWAMNEEGDLERSKGPFDLFQRRNDDGSFCFGVVVTLDYDANTWPKEAYGVTIRMHLLETECELKIANEKSFKVAISDPNQWGPAHDFMFEVLSRAFAGEPWEIPKITAIGFIQRE